MKISFSASPNIYRLPLAFGRPRRIALLVITTVLLGGCGVNRVVPPPNQPYDYRDRHPVVLADTQNTLDIFPANSNGRIDYTTAGRIREFIDRYRRFGHGPVTLLRPVGSQAATRIGAMTGLVREALNAAGLRDHVIVSDYPVTDPELAAPIRLSFAGIKAKVSGRCGEWPDDLASGASLNGWKNETWWNFGCAEQQTLAAQIADPRDLASPRGETPVDTLTRLRGIEAIRKGKDPGTEWRREKQDISRTGGFQ